ncbi:hypothetical protein HYV83_03595 [Candidatus Woesearchaeota archaeon]|nr:hypothetical protein [Candidatus Woesearchaeota archaeon]
MGLDGVDLRWKFRDVGGPFQRMHSGYSLLPALAPVTADIVKQLDLKHGVKFNSKFRRRIKFGKTVIVEFIEWVISLPKGFMTSTPVFKCTLEEDIIVEEGGILLLKVNFQIRDQSYKTELEELFNKRFIPELRAAVSKVLRELKLKEARVYVKVKEGFLEPTEHSNFKIH